MAGRTSRRASRRTARSIIYATRAGAKGTLAMVSADGRFQQRLSSDTGDVREPVWSPSPPRSGEARVDARYHSRNLPADAARPDNSGVR